MLLLAPEDRCYRKGYAVSCMWREGCEEDGVFLQQPLFRQQRSVYIVHGRVGRKLRGLFMLNR